MDFSFEAKSKSKIIVQFVRYIITLLCLKRDRTSKSM